MKIGIDKRDPSYRHFYYDDSEILTSNPPKYKVCYIDVEGDESDIDYIECSNVVCIKTVVDKQSQTESDVVIINTTEENKKNTKETTPKKKGRKKSTAETDVDIKVPTNQSTESITDTTQHTEIDFSKIMNIKFEYKTINFDFSSIDELTNMLNEYGESGWELCCSEIYSEGLIFDKKKILCIFKKVKGLE